MGDATVCPKGERVERREETAGFACSAIFLAVREKWLGSRDLNPDKAVQSRLCYRYTTPQPNLEPNANGHSISVKAGESRSLPKPAGRRRYPLRPMPRTIPEGK